MQRIYLDNNGTTQLDPRVLQAMLQRLQGPPANPSSIHSFGRDAKAALEKAREQVALFLKCSPSSITFTSGGTESIHLMLKSLPFKGHLITTRVEHSAVYECVRSLESQGWQVTYLPVDLRGAPQIDQIEEAICQNTLAFVFSASNGETGAKLDWPSVATLAERHKILFLLDAVAYVGKEPLSDLKGVSAMAISGHKFHGPKGVGVLYHHPTFKLQASLLGGHQERGKRAGTENLDAIVGLAEAFAILKESQPAITEHLFQLRDRFERGLQQAVSDIVIHGLGPRVSNTSNVAFLGVDGETLLMQLDLAGIAASHGSACSAGALEPSRVLLQMGISKKEARSSLRFSFSRMNTIEEVDATVACCAQLVSAFK